MLHNKKNSVIRVPTNISSISWVIFLIPLEISLLSSIPIFYRIETVPIQNAVFKYSQNFGVFHIWIVFSSLDKNLPNY